MRLVINNIGMISALGRDATTSCASVRAGLTRPAEILYHEVYERGEQESVPLIAYPVSGYTEGLAIFPRWLRIALGSLEDLLHNKNIPGRSDKGFWESTGLICVFPELKNERFDSEDDEQASQFVQRNFIPEFLDTSRLPIIGGNCASVCEGHIGTALALQFAEKIIAEDRLKRVLILAIDSYLDPFTLRWLSEMERLKSADQKTGLMPGEAGVCFLVEKDDVAPTEKSILVSGVSVIANHNGLHENDVRYGKALSNVWQHVLSQDESRHPFSGDIYLDLNGESWRSLHLGHAQVQTGSFLTGRVRYHVPATSLGEIGAASTGVAVGMVSHAFNRRYALCDTAIVLNIGEKGGASAIFLEKAIR